MDEIIDRVASRMTMAGERVVGPERGGYFKARQGYPWRRWAVAAAAVAAAVLMLPLGRSWRAGSSGPNVVVVLPSVSWALTVSSYAGPVASFPALGAVLAGDRVVSSRVTSSSLQRRDVRVSVAASPEWGIPEMPAPPMLTIPAVDVVPLELQEMMVAPVSFPSLSVDALSRPVEFREQ